MDLRLAFRRLAATPHDRFRAAGIGATPSIFKTLGVPLLRGRGFDDRDHAGAAPVVVLSALTARQIFGTIDRDGYRPVFEGLALGLFIGLAGRAIVRAYLEFDLDVVDPWILIVAPVPLILAAFCACYLPAQRAARVDPNLALRSE